MMASTGKSAPVRRLESTSNVEEANRVSSILVSKGYRLGPRIGKGSYAKVKVAERVKDGYIVAAKIISRHRAAKEFLRRFLPREISILLSVKHSSIVQVFEVIQTQDFVCLIVEYAEKGDLLSYIKMRNCLDEMEAKDIFYQVVDAVSYLHRRSICHRDLKCENILIRRDQSVALTDFGFSKLVSVQDPLSRTYCGSAAYASPELLRGKPYNPFVSDIWSLGCVLFVLISGQMPFYEKSTKKTGTAAALKSTRIKMPGTRGGEEARVISKKMMCRQLQGRVLYPEHCSVSKTCKDLVSKMLEPNIERRIDIAGVLEHQWLSGQNGRVLSSSNKKAGVHLLTRDTSSDVKKVESLGFVHGSTDVDGNNLSSSHSSGSHGLVQELKRTNCPKAKESCQVDEYVSNEASTNSRTSDQGTFQKRALSSSLVHDNQSKGKRRVVFPDLNMIGGSTQNLETPYEILSSEPGGTASCKTAPGNVVIAPDVHGFNKGSISDDMLNATMNMNKVDQMDLSGPCSVVQTFKPDVRDSALATAHSRSIDPTFQRDIENILRVPVSKYSQKRSLVDAQSRIPAFKRFPEIKPLTTVNHKNKSSQSCQTNKLPPENLKSVRIDGKSKMAPQDVEKPSETSSLPFNRYLKPGNSKKDDIASERFHVRQEGLVTQMRRIFESREATTNTLLTRTTRKEL